MTKRLLLLNGLACLMVPFHHAAAFTISMMLQWVDPPNPDFIGSFPYYFVMVVRQLDSFAIPAFLFVSGYFVAFLVRGKQSKLKWSAVAPRVKVLLAPFLIWTIIRFALLMQVPTSLESVLSTYYYVPLVIQLYLLSPLFVPQIKKNWKLILLLAAIMQLSTEGLRYLAVVGVDFPGLNILMKATPLWFFPRRILYFTIGAVAGIHIKSFKGWITRNKWWLLAMVVISGVFSIVEYELVAHLLGREWLGPNFSGIGRIVYATTFSLCFLAFNDVDLPFSEQLNELALKSLGIYLINSPAIYVVSSLMYRLTPSIVELPLVYFSILVVSGLVMPLILMELVRRTPAKAMYRYAFG